ncbi:fluoride efflux transporter FluC [Salimicrobium album]|uniref:Fluoride-specific ion channel FluC n=1 Tax=Salimicrobium album TaxID=50717 RepID=A0A1H3BB69_9BACI|nr:CrcB family protein [Salimicrobium album]SDX39163.1 CrcB protein [Salimicrobium album]
MIYIFIAVAGFIGAVLRYITGEVLFRPDTIFPFATLFINIVGSFLLSWLTFHTLPMSAQLKKAIGTGVLGSFTTFSTLSAETVSLLEREFYAVAFLYISLSFAGGTIAASAGSKAGPGKGGEV